MTHASVRALQAGCAALACAALPLGAQTEDKLNAPPNVIDGSELVQALRGGGHVLYFRHGITDLSTRDSDRASLDNCATQRKLSDAGRKQMRDIGRQFERLRIPVGAVLASPYCRTLETAKLAFGRVTPEPELAHTVTAHDATTRRRAGALSRMLATVPAVGSNTVIAGHTGNLQEATGIWPSPEGVAIVFKPDGRGSSQFVATIPPMRWAEFGHGGAPAPKHKR